MDDILSVVRVRWGNGKKYASGSIRFYIDDDKLVATRHYSSSYYFRRVINEFKEKCGETWDRHYMIVCPKTRDE
jgi:hypothetical protein